MRAWRVAKAARAGDLSGQGAAILGGRWNHRDVPVVYLGLTPAICCLETFVHASGRPTFPMKITAFRLPEGDDLYLKPDPRDLPEGWNSLPADRPSRDYGTRWLRAGEQLGLIVPSAVLPLEWNLLLNPRHPAMSRVRVEDSYDFMYDERMFQTRA